MSARPSELTWLGADLVDREAGRDDLLRDGLVAVPELPQPAVVEAAVFVGAHAGVVWRRGCGYAPLKHDRDHDWMLR
jgi:hypothetical protein